MTEQKMRRITDQWKKSKDACAIAARAAFRRFRGRVSLEELEAEAEYIFVKAFRFHRSGSFANHLNYKLKRRLASYATRQARQAHGLHSDGRPILSRLQMPDQPMGMHWSERISEESMGIVRLALQSDPRMEASAIRRALIEYLGEVGWTLRMIVESFSEIKECLTK